MRIGSKRVLIERSRPVQYARLTQTNIVVDRACLMFSSSAVQAPAMGPERQTLRNHERPTRALTARCWIGSVRHYRNANLLKACHYKQSLASYHTDLRESAVGIIGRGLLRRHSSCWRCSAVPVPYLRCSSATNNRHRWRWVQRSLPA